MPLSVQFDRDKNLLQVKAIDMVTIEEFGEVLEEMTSSDEYPPDTPAVWDLRAFEFSILNRDVMMEFILARERFEQRNNVKVAIVVNSTFGFGMGRMYELITSVRSNPQTVRTFRDLASAEAWLIEAGEQQ